MRWSRIPAKPPFGLLPLAVALTMSLLPQTTALPPTLDHRRVFALSEAASCSWISDCSSLETCVDNVCICRWGEIGQCPVPTTCAPGSEDQDCGFLMTSCVKCNYPNELVAAAQIALGAGLVFIVTALSVLICKTYLRWRFPSSRLSEADTESLNSVQRWVITRMRDRPPGYDDPPATSPSSNTGQGPGAQEACSSSPQYEKPPPYDATTESLQTAYAVIEGDLRDMPPPAYCEVVAQTAMGVINSAFLDEDEHVPTEAPVLGTVSQVVALREREEAGSPGTPNNVE